jgi:hypothetical protein
VSVTTTVARASLPYPTDRQFEALQLTLEAYHAFNLVDLDFDRHTAWADEAKGTPMGTVRTALIKALKLLPGVSQVAAQRILNECICNGESVRWNYDLWRVGNI